MLDQTDEFVAPVTVLSGEPHEVTGSLEDCSFVRGIPGDGDAASSPELEQSLVPKEPKGAKDRVCIHTQHRSQITRGRQAVSGVSLPLGDRPADLGRYLFVECGRIRPIHRDIEHSAKYNSTMYEGEGAEHERIRC